MTSALILCQCLMWRRLQVEEEGVTFRSPTDGSMMLLTPERRQVQQQHVLFSAAAACVV